MKILVTGGAGYIGSHTCVELLMAGHEVVVIDNLSNSKALVFGRIERICGRRPVFHEADVRNRGKVAEIISAHGIEAVIHFAGLKAVGESVAQPLRYYDNNVTGSLALFAAMADTGVRTLVFSSSATVYGDPLSVPIHEDAALSAANPYGRSKLMVEEILRDVYVADDTWHIALLRYFNPVGAHESGLIGEDPAGIPNNLMPYISQVAGGRRAELQIFGGDYLTPDGTGVRDYIHVVDIATGHIAGWIGCSGTRACTLSTWAPARAKACWRWCAHSKRPAAGPCLTASWIAGRATSRSAMRMRRWRGGCWAGRRSAASPRCAGMHGTGRQGTPADMKASSTKILFFVTEDWFVCSHWLPIIMGAKAEGYDVVVVTRTNRHAGIIEKHGARVIPFGISRRGSNLFREIAAIWRLTGIYREEKPDIVHHVAMKPMLYGSLAAHLLRIPHTVNWVAGMGWLFVSDRRQAKVLQAVVRKVLGMLLRGTSVIVENKDDREIIAGLGVGAGHIKLVRGAGVDTAMYAPTPQPDGIPLVVLPARMLRDKGVGEFVEAARQLQPARRAGQIRAGGRARYGESRQRARSNSCLPGEQEGAVEWWGRSEDMPQVYAQSRIVCLPSYREGLPKSLLEAASCARPVVTTQRSGLQGYRARRGQRDPGGSAQCRGPGGCAGQIAGQPETVPADGTARTGARAAGVLAGTDSLPGVVALSRGVVLSRILVTGAGGFIGRQLCGELLRRGQQVRAAVRAPCRLPEGVEQANGGCHRRRDGLERRAGRHRYHHPSCREDRCDERQCRRPAGGISQGQSAGHGESRPTGGGCRDQAAGLCQLDQGERRADTQRGKSLANRMCRHRRIHTASPNGRPNKPCSSIARMTGLEVVIVRPPLVYGPGVKGNFFRLLAAIDKGVPLPLSGAHNLRSMVYAGNLVDALIACASHPAAAGQTYLVSDGEDVSTAKLAENIAHALGRSSRSFYFPPGLLLAAATLLGRGEQAHRLFGSLQVSDKKIRGELGWAPPYSMEQGLRATADWYRTQRNGYNHGTR